MSRVLPAGAGLILLVLCHAGLKPRLHAAAGLKPRLHAAAGLKPRLHTAAGLKPRLHTAGQPAPGRPDAGGMPAPTAALERGRTVYVLNTCHFCHGVDLTKAQMGAAELMRSALVGADEHGNVIGPIVRAGIPNLQTSMPSYPDLTAQEVRDLAAYIHYLRQVGRHRELAAATLAPGDAAAGEKYFSSHCATCHKHADVPRLAANRDGGALKARVIGPPPPAPEGTGSLVDGRRKHLRLVEQMSDKDVNDLVAYLLRAARP